MIAGEILIGVFIGSICQILIAVTYRGRDLLCTVGHILRGGV